MANPEVLDNWDCEDQAPVLNPYVGPRSFEEEQSCFFFGRDEEQRQLTSLIIAHRVVLFYAQSGAGKTSLLRASVMPELKRRKNVVVLPSARVGGELPPGVAEDQVANIYVFNVLLKLAGAGAKPGELARLSLQEGLAAHLQPEAGERRPRPRLLILDQFEELFTSYPERAAERAGFFRQLAECLAAYPHLSLLLSMREDYIARLDHYAAQMPNRLRTRFRMRRLPVAGALAAVQKPAERAGRPFEPGVAEGLVDNLRRIQVGTAGEGVEKRTALGEFVEPVHLQIVCWQLWENLPPGGDTIRAQDVRAFGDVDQALTGFYEGTLQEVVRQTGIGARWVRAWFDDQLITPAETRGLVYRGREESGGLPNEAVELLNDAYIIRAVIRGGDTWYELAHDRLVEPILASNRTWRETHMSPLQRQAELWEQEGRPAGLLLRDEALEDAEAWAAANPAELAEVERAFLQRCREALAEQERRQARRNRTFAVVAGIIAIVAIGAAIWGSVGERDARRAQATAQAEAARAFYAQATAQAEATRAFYAQGTALAEATRALNAEASAEAEKERAEESQAIAVAALQTAAVDRTTAQAAATEALNAKATAEASEAELLQAYFSLAMSASLARNQGQPGELEPLDESWRVLVEVDSQIVAMSRESGEGIVLAVGHEAVLTEVDRYPQFLESALALLSGDSDDRVVLISTGHCEWAPLWARGLWLGPQGVEDFDTDPLVLQLREWGYEAKEITELTGTTLQDGNILIVGVAWGNFTEGEIEAVEQFVGGGGGLFAAGVGWSWKDYGTPIDCKGYPIEDFPTYPMNRLVAHYGMEFGTEPIPWGQ